MPCNQKLQTRWKGDWIRWGYGDMGKGKWRSWSLNMDLGQGSFGREVPQEEAGDLTKTTPNIIIKRAFKIRSSPIQMHPVNSNHSASQQQRKHDTKLPITASVFAEFAEYCRHVLSSLKRCWYPTPPCRNGLLYEQKDTIGLRRGRIKSERYSPINLPWELMLIFHASFVCGKLSSTSFVWQLLPQRHGNGAESSRCFSISSF